MANYLCNKRYVCEYNRTSKYCLTPWAREALINDCATACFSQGCSPDPQFYWENDNWPTLCSFGWVEREVERFKCFCNCCPVPGGPTV